MISMTSKATTMIEVIVKILRNILKNRRNVAASRPITFCKLSRILKVKDTDQC